MGLFDTLLDVVVGAPVRVVASVVKVAEHAANLDNPAEAVADTTEYIISGTSKDKRWDGHNVTGRLKE